MFKLKSVLSATIMAVTCLGMVDVRAMETLETLRCPTKEQLIDWKNNIEKWDEYKDSLGKNKKIILLSNIEEFSVNELKTEDYTIDNVLLNFLPKKERKDSDISWWNSLSSFTCIGKIGKKQIVYSYDFFSSTNPKLDKTSVETLNSLRLLDFSSSVVSAHFPAKRYEGVELKLPEINTEKTDYSNISLHIEKIIPTEVEKDLSATPFVPASRKKGGRFENAS